MSKSNSKTRRIYLDSASSALEMSANPGAIHALGVKEKNKLEEARGTIARVLNARSNEVVFTSGATESNNLAILGLMYPYSTFPYSRGRRKEGVKKPHIVTTNIEHSSVLEVCRHLQKIGQAEVTFVPVEANGIVDVNKIKKALRPETVLVSVMYANNEIGAIQPIHEISKEIRHFKKTHLTRFQHPLLNKERDGERFPFFHTDATQAVNYLSINVEELHVDLMSMNSAKIYGPKGIGALYVKKGTPLSPIMFGGEQEFGLRPGTESVALAAQFATALQKAQKIKEKESARLEKLRDYFFEKLRGLSKSDFDKDILVNGDLKNRLPNNVNITIPNIPSDLLVIELSEKGIMASAKSACKSGDGKSSYVIQAINPSAKPARNASPARNDSRSDSGRHSDAGGDTDGSLRFSLGRQTTKQDIDRTVKALSEILIKLKRWYD